MEQTSVISNKVYESIQPCTLGVTNSKSSILYANSYSGIGEVPITDSELLESFNRNSNLIGNNILVQLKNKMQEISGGPWYIDTKGSCIYIHNSNFNAKPIHVYNYQYENGEVLKVSFSTHYVTKNVSARISNDIDPIGKEIKSEAVTIPTPQNVSDQILKYEEWVCDRDNTSTFDIQSPQADPDNYQHPEELTSIQKAMASEQYGWAYGYIGEGSKNAWAVREETQKAYKEYQANGAEYMKKKGTSEHLNNLPLEDTNKIWDKVHGSLPQQDQDKVKKYLLELKGYAFNEFDPDRDWGKNPPKSNKEEALMSLQALLSSRYIKLNDVLYYDMTNIDVRDYAIGGKSTPDTPTIGGKISRMFGGNPWKAQEDESQSGLDRLNKNPSVIVEYDGPVKTNGTHSVVHGNTVYSTEATITTEGRLFSKKSGTVMVPAFQFLYGLIGRDDVQSAIKRSQNQATQIKEKVITSQMTVVGRPELASSQIIVLNNVGKKWSGPWYIKSCNHRIDSSEGYICDIELIRNTNKSKVDVSKVSVSTTDLVANGAKANGKSNYGKDKTLSDNKTSDEHITYTSDEVAYYNHLVQKAQETGDNKYYVQADSFAEEAVKFRELYSDDPYKLKQGYVSSSVVYNDSFDNQKGQPEVIGVKYNTSDGKPIQLERNLQRFYKPFSKQIHDHLSIQKKLENLENDKSN